MLTATEDQYVKILNALALDGVEDKMYEDNTEGHGQEARSVAGAGAEVVVVD